MSRRVTLSGPVLVAVVLLIAGMAMADRLGGAYRGPFDDEAKPREATSTEVTADAEPSTEDAAADTPDEGEGKPDDSPETDPQCGPHDPSDDPEEGGRPPPPSTPEEYEEASGGQSSGGNAATPPPPSDSGTIGGSAGFGAGLGGKTALIDIRAYWPYYFEHNKEAILSSVLAERASRGQIPPNSSSWFFGSTPGSRQVTPLSDDQKSTIVLPVLIEALSDNSPWVRDAACLALGKFGGAEAAHHLARSAARETDLEVKQDVLLSLGLTGSVKALYPLLSALRHKDPRVRPYAALGLALLGRDEAVLDLLTIYKELWKAGDEEQAAIFAIALGHLIGPEHVDDLAAPLKKQGLLTLKAYVCQALGNVGGETAIRWLVRCSMTERGDVRAAVALALSRFTNKGAVGVLLGGDLSGGGHRMTRVFAKASLGRVGGMLRPRNPLRDRIRAQLQGAAEKPLKDHYAAMYATLGLGLMRARCSNEYFRLELGTEKQVRYPSENYSAMVMALALSGDRDSLRCLRDLLRKRGDPALRGTTALALGLLGDSQSRGLFRGFLEDPRERGEVQRPACWALGLVGDRRDVPLLLELLELDLPNKHTVRGAAAQAIGLIGDRSALWPLVEMATEDVNSSNRAFAIVALGCMVDPAGLPRLPQLFENIHYRIELDVCRSVLRNL